MLPALATEDYGQALSLGVDLIAQAFAAEFGVALTVRLLSQLGECRASTWRQDSIGWILGLIIFLLAVTRGRILWWVLWGLSQSRGGGRGWWMARWWRRWIWRIRGGGGFSGGGAGGRF